ncbi:MAG: protein kinase [Chthoniobacteraceae bacterium]
MSSDLASGMRSAEPEQRLFNRYTLKKVIGRGGMGIVWLAHDDELSRNVAMKFLPDMIIRDREAVEDLKRETRRSLDLTHHHIVRIYDFTQDEISAAIIMEYVDGESLSTLKTMQPGGCFDVSTIHNWIGHFCLAMDYANRQARIVHRDLKPANLMVNGRGELKVTDFGISRSMSDSMTRVSMSNNAGTLAYMSPEQALGAPPSTGDDIYAFGATVYDLLTGKPPFFRGNLQVQLETVIPPSMAQRRTELGTSGEPIPTMWEETIAACLSKEPEQRPPHMWEIANLLGVGGGTTGGSSFQLRALNASPAAGPDAPRPSEPEVMANLETRRADQALESQTVELPFGTTADDSSFVIALDNRDAASMQAAPDLDTTVAPYAAGDATSFGSPIERPMVRATAPPAHRRAKRLIAGLGTLFAVGSLVILGPKLHIWERGSSQVKVHPSDGLEITPRSDSAPTPPPPLSDAEQWFAKAETHLTEGRFPEAKEALTTAIASGTSMEQAAPLMAKIDAGLATQAQRAMEEQNKELQAPVNSGLAGSDPEAAHTVLDSIPPPLDEDVDLILHKNKPGEQEPLASTPKPKSPQGSGGKKSRPKSDPAEKPPKNARPPKVLSKNAPSTPGPVLKPKERAKPIRPNWWSRNIF